jgi:hypothetical protein
VKLSSAKREVLLIEIERRCKFADCGVRNRFGLTKAEAIEYRGFECRQCKRWNDDVLNYTDTPDWWDEIDSAVQ